MLLLLSLFFVLEVFVLARTFDGVDLAGAHHRCPSGSVVTPSSSAAMPDVCRACLCCQSTDGSGLSVECPTPRLERAPRRLSDAAQRRRTAGVPLTSSETAEPTSVTATENSRLATRYNGITIPTTIRDSSEGRVITASSGDSTVAVTTKRDRGETNTNATTRTTTVATENAVVTVSPRVVATETSSTVAVATEAILGLTTNAMVPKRPRPTRPTSPNWQTVARYLPFSLKGPYHMSHRICKFLAQNPNLKTFACKNCKIEFFPVTCLKKTPNLKELLIPNNLYLKFNLNALFLILPRLEVLDLSDQNFLGIEFRNNINFPKHSSLKILKLNNNLLIRDLSARISLTGLSNIVEIEMTNVCVDFLLDKLDISGLTALEKFVFSNNRAWMSGAYAPEFVFQRLNSLKHLDLSLNQLGRLTQLQFVRLFQPIRNTLEYLHLGHNDLTFLNAPIFEDMLALKTINLVENSLKVVQSNLFESSPSLERVLLSDNQISFLDAGMFRRMTNLSFLSIEENEFECDCALRQFRDWGHGDGVMILGLYSHGERCFASDKRLDSRVTEYETEWIECDHVREYIIAGALGLFFAFATLLAGLVYRYRYDLLWWLLKRRRRRPTTAGERYHAFVSYNSRDSRFTLSMIRYLEDGDDIRFKISFDGCFDPASFISDCIVQCIERSEKIIFVVSRTFLQSEWCSYELRMGELKCFEERRNIMILIFLEKIPVKELPRSLRTLVRQINYLQWPVDEDQRARDVFWKRLKIALSKDAKLSTKPELVNPDNDPTIV